MEEKQVLPNYFAIAVAILALVPLMFLEADFETYAFKNSFIALKKNFGFVMILELLMIGIASIHYIKNYDQYELIHKIISGTFILIIGAFIFALLFGYLGYFNGGLEIFKWLNT